MVCSVHLEYVSTMTYTSLGSQAFIFGEDIKLGLELLDGFDRTRDSNNLTAFELLSLHATKQNAHIVSGFTLSTASMGHLTMSGNNKCLLCPIPCGTSLFGCNLVC